MALVPSGTVLVSFINKPGLVRDTDGCWPVHLLYTQSDQIIFADFFTYLSFVIPGSLYYPFPMSSAIIFNLTVCAFGGETQ